MIIVGAGPIGLFIGKELSSMGYDTLILEEHSEIGNPCHCSGLFSWHIFDMVGKIGILHEAKYATIHAPDGSTLSIGDGRTQGYVVDRVKFDREMAKRAVEKGAEIHLKERVLHVNYPVVKTRKNEYRANIIVGADGINSVVRKKIGVRLRKILGAAQVIARYPVDNLEKVDIYLGSKVAPGFFAWKIPLFDNLVKIGLASYGNSWMYLKSLLKRMNARALSISGGGIPIGTVERTYSKGMLIVGDAAGHVKATSGGGVYPGLMAARCAVKIIDKALSIGDYSSSILSEYENCWKKTIGKELKNALYLHRIYRKIRDEDFNRIIKDLNEQRIIEVINEYGDIDYPSRVATRVLRRKPSLLKYLSIPARPYRKQI
ncbi:geranylgeranyl reductase family protein [Aciduliprofundum sp. MAR08-339]|nr:geranylgeranyl reductase family protein [Aciduliprofundum sp. MAR08-339]